LKEYIKEKKISVVAIGPGLGREKETIEFARQMIEFLVELKMPIIIDADALNAIARNDESYNIKNFENFESFESFELPVFEKFKDIKKNIIITPHNKELQRLINAEDIVFKILVGQLFEATVFLCRSPFSRGHGFCRKKPKEKFQRKRTKRKDPLDKFMGSIYKKSGSCGTRH